MRILVNQEEIDLFKKRIMSSINIIEEDINKMELIKDNLIWRGNSFNTFIRKYDENLANIKNKIESLNNYVNFLDVFNDKYNNAQNIIKCEYGKVKGVNNER